MPRGNQPPYYEPGTPEHAAYEVGKSDGKLSGLKAAEGIVRKILRVSYSRGIGRADVIETLSALRRAARGGGK